MLNFIVVQIFRVVFDKCAKDIGALRIGRLVGTVAKFALQTIEFLKTSGNLEIQVLPFTKIGNFF